MGIGRLAQFILNNVGSFVTGFQASQTSTPSLSINLGIGQIYQYENADSSPLGGGSVPADTTQVIQQGYAAAQSVALNTSSIVSGQSQWWLIEATFSPVDGVRPDDSTEGDRPFYNSSNPSVPLEGQNGLGGIIPAVRAGVANIQAISGVPATTGTAVPPNPSAGYVPLYLIELTFGQTAITNGQIQVAGPDAYGGYPYAPFLAGLLQTHHMGIPGQAPQIDLTKEVQNILGLAHLPASNTVGILSCLRLGSGSPNGVLAGNVPDTYFDTTNVVWYICTSAGPATGPGAAVWTPLGLTASDNYVNTSPYTVTKQFGTYFLDSTAGPLVINISATAANPGRLVFRNIGSPFNPITFQSTIGGQNVEGDSSYIMEGRDSITLEPDTTHSNWWITS